MTKSIIKYENDWKFHQLVTTLLHFLENDMCSQVELKEATELASHFYEMQLIQEIATCEAVVEEAIAKAKEFSQIHD